MDMVITFPGGKRVDAQWGAHTIKTDQPAPGGNDSAPAPFDLFLASIGTCAGIYILGFCQSRNIPTDGIKIVQQMQVDPTTGMTSKVFLDIQLPPDFPEKYKDAVIRSADQCKVKKHLHHPPEFEITTSTK